MSERIFLGPFLTRAQAARRAGITRHDVALRPDLLRLAGPWLEEAYFAFQFDGKGVHRPVADVVRILKPGWDDATIADWLVRPNPRLHGFAPLEALRKGTAPDRVLEAAPTVPAAPRSGSTLTETIYVRPPPRLDRVTRRPRLAGS